MGVDRTDYIIYGYKMPYDYPTSKGINIWGDKKFLPYIEGWKGEDYSLIQDGMGGEYCVFGLRIAHASEPDGFTFIELPPEGWPTQAEAIKQKFVEVFGFTDAELGEPKVLIFSHYS